MPVYRVCSSENLIEHSRNRLFFKEQKLPSCRRSRIVEDIMNCMTHLKLYWCVQQN